VPAEAQSAALIGYIQVYGRDFTNKEAVLQKQNGMLSGHDAFM